ncbi:MAG TPA: 7TM diverse intracellular signaling domain-containing protein, partial [Cytophagaceae bacterium]
MIIRNVKILMLLLSTISRCNLSYAQDTSDLNERDTVPQFSIYCYRDHAKRKDEEVIKEWQSLFRPINVDKGTNISDKANTIIWLNIRFATPLKHDLVLDFLPFYEKVTVYYFTRDSVIHKYMVGLKFPFMSRKYYTNTLLANLPANSINNYFIKYEFNNHFKVAGFQIKESSEIFNESLKTFISHSILFTSILLIFLLSIVFYALNKEPRYLYYGLYALFFGLFAASCLHVLYMIPHLNFISHSTFIYYVPFSLSTIFFALYILTFIRIEHRSISYTVLYGLLLIKALSLMLAFLDNEVVETWMNNYLSQLDVIIYAFLLWHIVATTLKNPKLTHYWLTFGVFIMLIGQIIHTRSNGNMAWIYSFMCFDILWFGIGLAINYKITKDEKIGALNDVIQIKNTYNKELEAKVEERTFKLNENIKIIDELNSILKANNLELSQNLTHLEQERILNKDLSIEEFKSIFPDKETCLNLLVHLKWGREFVCDACGNTKFFQGKDPYNKKCTKCGKMHSATNNTLFHNIKFPLEKAFYIVFLCTSNKKYTIESISEI